MKKWFFYFCMFSLCLISSSHVQAENDDRMTYYKEYEFSTNIPWYNIAAIDQFERNTKHYRSYCPKEDEVISICIDPLRWSGMNNPYEDDYRLYTIKLFNGMGMDGNRDGVANRLNSHDRMSAMMNYILDYGVKADDVKEALQEYYQDEKSVKIIFEISRLFETYQTIDLSTRVFPIPKGYDAGYTNSYGTARSFGGLRSHEGIDIFAYTGTPVLSTAYGIVEIKGWNRLGGYRIGIRDMFNTYEFYAHLSGYAKGIKEGDIVEPGQVIGYVGSTGYGKEGTSGKFPPHLHFGFYKYDGKKEWSFNSYPYLKSWQKVRAK